ncbi:MAG: SDR family oxidoreductase [Euryarchaeota archaeon]|nr:SDR family oxidoreductase [Euryarchaeota archaeon]
MTASASGRRVAVVTGANSGIGKEVSRGLLRHGFAVVMACRDTERGEASRAELMATVPDADARVMALDLSSLESVRAFAARFQESFPGLDVLVNNAGVYLARRSTTVEGFETTFGVNHLGHFLLTGLLLDPLKRSAPSRVITVASEAHRGGFIDFDDLQGEKRWNGLKAYTQSKLANVLFSAELGRRLDGTGVTSNSMHPGAVRTRWAKGQGWLGAVMMLGAPFMTSAERGADTATYLAVSSDVQGVSGRYFIKRRPREPSLPGRDPETGKRLWAASAELTKRPTP